MDLRMRSTVLIDFLPDAVCVVDASGNIKQSNRQFNKKFSVCHEPELDESLNFVQNVLHPDQHAKFFKGLNVIRSCVFLDGDAPSVALGATMSFMKNSPKQYPTYRNIDWTLSGTDREDSFILIGRNPSILQIGESQTNVIETPANGTRLRNTAKIPSPLTLAAEFIPETAALPIEEFTHFAMISEYFQCAPVPLHFLSSTGRIIWANDAELRNTGYSAEEYVGHEIMEFLCPSEREKLQETMAKLVTGQTILDVSFKFRSKSGEAKHFLINSNAVFGCGGESLHIRCFMRPDPHYYIRAKSIQEKNKLSRKHAESRTAFIRNVFHEIRTPMHVLSNFFSDSNPSRQDFDDMRHHTDAILGIVEDLTFSTAFEAGEVSTVNPVAQHLPTILTQVVEAVNSVEQKAGGRVEIKVNCLNVDSSIEEVTTDPFFKRVLFSLLSNAVKFSPMDGIVYVTVTHSIKSRDIVTHSRLVSEFNTVHSSGSSTPRKPKHPDPFVSTLPTICENLVKEMEVEVTEGFFTFHFRNTTAAPMNVSLVTKFFKSYYHSRISSGNFSSSGSVAGSSYSNLLDLAAVERKEGSVCSDCISPNFKDLNQYSGLGLGLYTAYNMVTLMGGTLECTVENDDEACFWFTIPSSFIPIDRSRHELVDTMHSRMERSKYTMAAEEAVILPAIRSMVKEQLQHLQSPYTNSSPPHLPIAPTGNLFFTNPPEYLTPSFAILSQPPSPGIGTDTSTSYYDSFPSRNSGKCTPAYREFPEQRILVVDDSRICQKVAGRTLANLEFVLDYASNGLEACNKLSVVPLRYNAVLMDLRMPVMDGLEAIRKCRNEFGLTKLPIVALTAEVGASIKEEAMKAGANWFLTKPAKAQELISVLRALSFAKL